MIEKRVSNLGILYIRCIYAEEIRLHHPRLDWSVCKFQACDRYRKSRYSPHTSAKPTYYMLHGFLFVKVKTTNPQPPTPYPCKAYLLPQHTSAVRGSLTDRNYRIYTNVAGNFQLFSWAS